MDDRDNKPIPSNLPYRALNTEMCASYIHPSCPPPSYNIAPIASYRTNFSNAYPYLYPLTMTTPNNNFPISNTSLPHESIINNNNTIQNNEDVSAESTQVLKKRKLHKVVDNNQITASQNAAKKIKEDKTDYSNQQQFFSNSPVELSHQNTGSTQQQSPAKNLTFVSVLEQIKRPYRTAGIAYPRYQSIIPRPAHLQINTQQYPTNNKQDNIKQAQLIKNLEATSQNQQQMYKLLQQQQQQIDELKKIVNEQYEMIQELSNRLERTKTLSDSAPSRFFDPNI